MDLSYDLKGEYMKKILIVLSFLFSIATVLFYTHATTTEIIIALDAGHGGMDGGAMVQDIKEADLTLLFTKKMKEVFEKNGYKAILTRSDENDLCEGEFVKKEDMNKRVEIIHQSKATLALSIHMNKFSIAKYRGAQVFYSHHHPDNMFLADSVQKTLKIHLKNTERSIVNRENIYLLNHVAIPCCIIECGFMSNPSELDLLQSEEYQYQFAVGVLLGVETYLSVR